MAASLILHLTGKKQAGNFVGQWVPTILVAGVYNKLVKLQGHDKHDAGEDRKSPVRGLRNDSNDYARDDGRDETRDQSDDAVDNGHAVKGWQAPA